MMLAHVYLDKGCIVPMHSHENEQLTYILEGVLRFWLGEDEAEVVDVRAGEVLHLLRGCRTRPRRSRTRSTSTSSPAAAGLARRLGRLPPAHVNLGLDGRGRARLRREPGLGRAIADELAAEGATLAVCSRTPSGWSRPPPSSARSRWRRTSPSRASRPGWSRRPRSASDASTSSWRTPAAAGRADTLTLDWDRAIALLLRSTVELATAALPDEGARLGPHPRGHLGGREEPVDNLILSNSLRAAVTGFAKTLSREVARTGSP